MSRVEGKVAFITGAARGQGRSHAVRLAEEGADIIAVDACEDMPTAPYPGGSDADLARTVKEVEALGRRIVAVKADVRDLNALKEAAAAGVSELGHIDVVIANAGIFSLGSTLELSEETWQTVIDVDLTGAWKTAVATVPYMVERGAGGSVIFISSVAGVAAVPHLAHYVAAKHGLVGLMRTLSIELAAQSIRVNSIHPTTVDTPMVANAAIYETFTGGAVGTTRDEAAVALKALHAMPIPWVDPIDISNGVLYLASDESRYVTGTTMVIDGGAALANKLPN